MLLSDSFHCTDEDTKASSLERSDRFSLRGDLLDSFFDGSMEGDPSADVFVSGPEETPAIAYAASKPEKSCMQSIILFVSVEKACAFCHYFVFLQHGSISAGSRQYPMKISV